MSTSTSTMLLATAAALLLAPVTGLATTFDRTQTLAGLPPPHVMAEGGYEPLFPDKLEQEEALTLLKSTFEDSLKENVNLVRVSCPMFLTKSSGFNDNLNGVERPATFAPRDFQDIKLEVPFSLAKWKRWANVSTVNVLCVERASTVD
jgi:aspartate--ammonia ligase